MASHNELGKLGENIAQRYLLEHGYAILETSWRIGRVEADIIAYYEGQIIFVEVKTRSSDKVTSPEDAVNLRKQRTYIRLANAYVLQKRREEEVRFDIMSIIVRGIDDVEIRHFKNAYTTVG